MTPSRPGIRTEDLAADLRARVAVARTSSMTMKIDQLLSEARSRCAAGADLPPYLARKLIFRIGPIRRWTNHLRRDQAALDQAILSLVEAVAAEQCSLRAEVDELRKEMRAQWRSAEREGG